MCDSCNVLYINRVKCHEHGCPDAWKDEIRECKNCGSDFKPEAEYQQFCSESCWCMYNGYPYPDDDFEYEEDNKDNNEDDYYWYCDNCHCEITEEQEEKNKGLCYDCVMAIQ